MDNKPHSRSREAEKEHVRRIGNTEWLERKPFLAQGSLDIDRALTEIAVFTALVENLPFGPGARILDAGSGPCWISEWLQKLGFETCSTDLAVDMLSIGKKRLRPGSSLVAADMASLPLANQSFHGVVCYGALHHVPNWPEALREFHRVLRADGILVLQEPGRGHGKQAESIAQMEQFGVLEQDLPPRILKRACLEAGFEQAWVRPMCSSSQGRTRIMPPYPFFRGAPRLFMRKRMAWLRTLLLEHFLNLFSPMHIVVAAKGQVWADSLRPETMVARVVDVQAPSKIRPGEKIDVRLRILNTGMTRWRAEPVHDGMGHVSVGVSLIRGSDEGLQDLDYGRLALPGDVPPGQAVEVSGTLPPLAPGNWILRFDLVAEGLFWFANKGSRTAVRKIECR